jgi:hypothetical protein
MNVKDSEDKPDTAFELAKRRFKQASDADKRQREREREGLRFQVPENQWTQAAKDARAGGPGVPARPMLSVSKLDQPIRMITNQERNAKLGIQVHPLSEGANDDTAGVLQDLYRAIERDSNAAQARSWAFDRAVKVGRGWYRITTEYDENASDDGPDAFDQVIRIRRILDQSMVYVDPSATETDFSDARYLFMTAWVPVSTFKREYPKAERSASREFLVDSAEPEWVSGEGEDKAVLVAEHWEKEYTYEDLTVGDQTRKVEKCTVYVTKMTGAEIVEPRQQWNGHLIPFVPVLGRELQPFDEERRFEGVIGPNMDAQRAYNYALSSAVEGAALEPKAPLASRGSSRGTARSGSRRTSATSPTSNTSLSSCPAEGLPRLPRAYRSTARGCSFPWAWLRPWKARSSPGRCSTTRRWAVRTASSGRDGPFSFSSSRGTRPRPTFSRTSRTTRCGTRRRSSST